MMPRLAVLRPEPGNAVTMARVQATGMAALSLPLFAVRSLEWDAPDPTTFDALILTSANAVRHAGGQLDALRTLPVYAVGTATADAARTAGLRVEATGHRDADALLAMAEAQGVRRALHLAGREHRLRAGGVVASVLPIYAADVLEVSEKDAMTLIDTIALLHSPRAGNRLADIVTAHRLDRTRIALAAISAAAAQAAGKGWRTVTIASEPTDAALIAAAAQIDPASRP
ncbi:uroporphyrinogen-III synthase [Stakelama sediminis]|uniref:Uroporphyrinogen-III synthase n=1 Tax=Stakelama sediminis TaxID=463200 RepID=A0A840Z1I6_9SPHN|nr:uroporphyrinogen-III synthase [Stakelama sediminis]MBB5719848.1 uroporphyrinogen-III synthase [Stakelama sediminis]